MPKGYSGAACFASQNRGLLRSPERWSEQDQLWLCLATQQDLKLVPDSPLWLASSPNNGVEMVHKYQNVMLGAVLALSASLSWAQPDQAEPAETYLPLFVMYSGSATPQQMQVLRQFFASNKLPNDVIAEALETVGHKLNAFKAGFAFPVFRDETSTSGHTCVVAGNHHGEMNEAWTLLASERVYRPLLLGRNEQLESQQLLDSVYAHELFHCYDLVRHSLVEVGQQILEKGSPYFAYWGEVGADAYSALQHLQHGGDKELLRTVRDFRTLNLLNGDSVHYTALTIDYIIDHHSRQTLQGMSTRQLIALADQIRQETALVQDEFAKLEGAAAKVNREYEKLLVNFRGLGKPYEGGLMQPLEAEVSPEYVGAVYAQMRAALWRLGGKKSVNSLYFSPLGEQFDLTRLNNQVARLN